MLPDGAIAVERVWKRFRLDQQRPLLRDKIAQLPRRLRRGQRLWRWALRDVTLRVDRGGSVGIVGVNGSGKSTLLKILGRVMYPYAGRVEVYGRLAGLIDIRAGIHPDLTGEENVYLYGMLLGLPRRQVIDRFEEIVAFAELQDSIRGQVKYYSTGMQMRLGFSVAALLQPDILLVDEVLTVGDAAFQQKCLDRMQLLLGRGTTLVLVSHDLAAIEATCARAVWLHEGRVRADGTVREVLTAYRRHIEQLLHAWSARSDILQVDGVRVVAPGNGGPRSLGPLEIQTTLRSPAHQTGVIHVGVSEGLSTPIFVGRRDVYLRPGGLEVRCQISHLPLPRGRFYVWMGVFDRPGRDLLPWQAVGAFDVTGPDLDVPPHGVSRMAPVHVSMRWQVAER